MDLAGHRVLIEARAQGYNPPAASHSSWDALWWLLFFLNAFLAVFYGLFVRLLDTPSAATIERVRQRRATFIRDFEHPGGKSYFVVEQWSHPVLRAGAYGMRT